MKIFTPFIASIDDDLEVRAQSDGAHTARAHGKGNAGIFLAMESE